MNILMAAVLPAAMGARAADLVSLNTQSGSFTIDTTGSLRRVVVGNDGRNCLAEGQAAPVLQVRLAGEDHAPDSASWDAAGRRMTLHYRAVEATAVLSVVAKPTHVTMELIEVAPKDRVELVLWGPYPTSIGDLIGEIVGVVRDGESAIGIQALNAKTLGGFPSRDNDICHGGRRDDPGRYPDLSPELNKQQLFRGNTAWPMPFGSVLQAYCRDRSRERTIDNWGHRKYVAPPYTDGGVEGSKVALFACPAEQALDTIGQIEIAEGLPHPVLDGVWGKVSPTANASYLIVDFGESTIDQAIAMTRRAGLHYLYHSSPFHTWGHFELKPTLFPHGRDGLRACVDKARQAGVLVGFHTLSNFITPNDAYVTPKPDPRLARIGTSSLTAPVDAGAQELPLASAEVFRKKTVLNTVVIGNELVRYKSVEENRLTGCQRGAWGTAAAAHEPGTAVGKLMDHAYKVFLTDAALSREVAGNIAALCSDAGIRQISMDGLEGNWSTGYGQYGRILFAAAWYDGLAPDLRGHVRSDASNPSHFAWHINTYYNWGEPWYAGFRESQTLYRFKNQLFYTRNLLPRMLGWFALRPDTTLADAEWLLARAAGYDAGFALATSLDSTAQQKAGTVDAHISRKGAILEAVKQWETARLAQAFPDNVKAQLRDNSREFHLAPAGEGQWDLYPVEAGRRGVPRRVKAN